VTLDDEKIVGKGHSKITSIKNDKKRKKSSTLEKPFG
jgi:hypothetical protein